MRQRFHFTTAQLLMLLLNLLVLGGCLVLMVLTGPSGPLILLAISTALMAIGKLGKARIGAQPKQQPETDYPNQM